MAYRVQGHPCFLKGEAQAAHGHTGLMIQKTRIKFPTRSYRDHQRIPSVYDRVCQQALANRLFFAPPL